MRRRAPQLHPVHLVRHERALRVRAADAAGSGLAKRRTELLRALRGADDGRAADEHPGAAEPRDQQRQKSVRRSLQLLMSLLSPQDQERLKGTFDEMLRPVRLLFFTQTLGCETCLQARQILDELPALSARIAIEEVNFVLDA